MRRREDHEHDVHDIRRAEDDPSCRPAPFERNEFPAPHSSDLSYLSWSVQDEYTDTRSLRAFAALSQVLDWTEHLVGWRDVLADYTSALHQGGALTAGLLSVGPIAPQSHGLDGEMPGFSPTVSRGRRWAIKGPGGTRGADAKRGLSEPEPSPAERPLAPAGSAPPQVDWPHIFEGHINSNGRAVGFHSRPGGGDRSGARVTRILRQPDARGVYEADVEIKSPSGQWIPKNGKSSFFPDTWPEAMVRAEVLSAYANRVEALNGYWVGQSASGVFIGGYASPGFIKTAFPIYGR